MRDDVDNLVDRSGQSLLTKRCGGVRGFSAATEAKIAKKKTDKQKRPIRLLSPCFLSTENRD